MYQGIGDYGSFFKFKTNAPCTPLYFLFKHLCYRSKGNNRNRQLVTWSELLTAERKYLKRINNAHCLSEEVEQYQTILVSEQVIFESAFLRQAMMVTQS